MNTTPISSALLWLISGAKDTTQLADTHLTRLEELPAKYARQVSLQFETKDGQSVSIPALKMGKAPKYGNKKTEYDWELYDSKKEAEYARDLDVRLKAEDILGWRRQVRLPLRADGQLLGTYVCDFEITHNDLSVEYVEVKGYWTDLARFKAKVFTANYPDVKLTVV